MENNKGSGIKGIIIAIVMCVLIIAGAFAGKHFLFDSKKPADADLTVRNLRIDTSAENLEKGNQELVERRIYFAGLPDGEIGKNSAVLLRNPKANEDIYIQYSISNDDTGEVIFESDLIESDKYVSWVPGETLDAGTYSLSVTQQPYYQVDGDGWIPLTTGKNTIQLTITDVAAE